MKENIFSINFWSTNFVATFNQLKGYVISYLPSVLAAIIVLILGIVLAKIVRFLGKKIGRLIFRLFFTVERKLRLKSTKDKFSKTLGFVLYWVVLIYFAFFALKVLNIPGVSKWMAQMVNFIPQMISLFCIAIVGFLLGTFAKESIYDKTEREDGSEPYLLAHSVKYGIFAFFTLWGLGQLGIDISIFTGFIAIILAAVVGAGALGFGLGSGAHVANLIASYNLRKQLQIGESIRINNYSGVIIDITNTGIVVEGIDGTVIIPAKIANEQILVKNK